MTSLVDNDIVLKASCYGLVDELLLPVCGSLELAGVLGAVRFVVSRRIKKMGLNGGPEDALSRLESLLDRASKVEPTDDEQVMAADFELAAQRANVSLDTGESHLCALMVSRGMSRLLTGDKRAVAAIEVLLNHDKRLSALCGRVSCLEQLVSFALNGDSGGRIRTAICGQPTVDKTLTICSGCFAKEAPGIMIECLDSYIRDLRSRAGRVLSS